MELDQIIHNKNNQVMIEYLNSFKNNSASYLNLTECNGAALPTYTYLLDQGNDDFKQVFNKTILFNIGLLKSNEYALLQKQLEQCDHLIFILSNVLDDKQTHHGFVLTKFAQYNITSPSQILETLLQDDDVKKVLQGGHTFDMDKNKITGYFLDNKVFLRKLVDQIQTKTATQKQLKQLHNKYLTIVSQLPDNSMVNNNEKQYAKQDAKQDARQDARQDAKQDEDQHLEAELTKRKKRLHKLKDRTLKQVLQAVFPLHKVPFETIEQCKSKSRKEKYYISRVDLIKLIDNDPDLKKLFKSYKSKTKEQLCSEIFQPKIDNNHN